MFRVSILLSLMIKAVSSAKSRTRNDEACTMSLIYIENKVGPRIEPCGTPHLITLMRILRCRCQRWARYFFKVPAVPVLGTLLKVLAVPVFSTFVGTFQKMF